MLGWSISNRITRFSKTSVLVPFDVGVVYIKNEKNKVSNLSFSPLRCWGGLYPSNNPSKTTLSVLVPFDVGVVYILAKQVLFSVLLF